VSTRAFGLRVSVNNSDDAYISRVLEILSSIGVNNWTTSRRTSKVGTKDVCTVMIAELDSIIKVLSFVNADLVVKRAFAEKALALALLRRSSRDENGERAPWTDYECALAESIRAEFMPNSCAYGETPPAACGPRVIPSEALGSATSTKEPLESRAASSACSNRPQECPAPLVGDDVLRSSAKAESWDKEPSEDIATN
jgi:hypothetical protein